MKKEKNIKENLIKLLPKHIYESEELGVDAKNLLGTLLQRIETSKAGETGIVYLGKHIAAKEIGIRVERLIDPMTELKLYNLLDWENGTGDFIGNGKRNATIWKINWDALDEPLQRQSFSERYGRFKSGKKSLGTPIQYNSIQNNTNHINSNQNNIKSEQTNLNQNKQINLNQLKKYIDIKLKERLNRCLTEKDVDKLEDELILFLNGYSNIEEVNDLKEVVNRECAKRRCDIVVGTFIEKDCTLNKIF